MNMHPTKDPNRRCLKPDAWPEADRRAWEAALQKGDLLEPGGVGADWAPHTRREIAKGYGRWLTWLENKGVLDPRALPADRVTPERVAQYFSDLQSLNAPYTVVMRMHELHRALSAMATDGDWCWIQGIEARARRTATSVRNKRARIVASGELFSYGLELMIEADGPAGGTPLQRASHYRDGLMIALLAARPLRRRNFAAIEVGRHFVRQGDAYWLCFDAAETKTREPIEAPFPTALILNLERYLTHHRPLLAQRTGRWNKPSALPRRPTMALWVSKDGSAMTEIAIYFRIVKLTRIKFGQVVNLHLFRDCAATSIATQDPEHIFITRSILGHSTLRASERHYNHARSLQASRRYQRSILVLRKQGRARDHYRPVGPGRQEA